MNIPVRRALISVSDKTGVVDLARELIALGVTILSTGGTARLLADEGLAVTEVSAHTGFPEMLDGRVKTLHPKIHAALLARREVPAHVDALAQHDIDTIDLLVVNLYPFEATIARADCTLEEAIENIDIGGPAMVRSGAKNWRGVGVLTDAAQYASVLQELRAVGGLGDATRFALSVAAFDAVARYDGAISNYLSSLRDDRTRGSEAGDGEARSDFPKQLNRHFIKLQDLRYGENPHQRAAFYRDPDPKPGALASARQLQGKELSYNNIADADAAWECVQSFDGPACVIVKHANPCGVALGQDAAQAWGLAFRTDPVSAFGGIIAFNCPVDGAAARALSGQFVEVVLAPSYDDEARSVLQAKANVRVLVIAPAPGSSPARQAWDLKRVGGGLLVQSADRRSVDPNEWKPVTKIAPTEAQRRDLLFAWRVAKYVKSNAIVFCGNGATLGVGAGQMSRVDSTRIASIKAGNAGLDLRGSVVASDAFFPFRDGLDVLAEAGAIAVIQPGGSMRDEEVIAAADEHGIAMVFTGVRHFRH